MENKGTGVLPGSAENGVVAATAFITPKWPVACHKQQDKRPIGSISGAEGETNGDAAAIISSTAGIKQGMGKTGVKFYFYKKKEYNKLTKE